MAKKTKMGFAFGKKSYQLLIVGLIISAVGFILMIGGGSEDPDVFNENEIFSPRILTFGPIFVLTGYVVQIFAIMKKPKDQPTEQ